LLQTAFNELLLQHFSHSVAGVRSTERSINRSEFIFLAITQFYGVLNASTQKAAIVLIKLAWFKM